MGVVYCLEIAKERSQSGKYQETYTYTRGWVVRVNDPLTPLPDITNAACNAWLLAHPDDASCVALEFDTKASDDTGLVYTVSVKYYAPPTNNDSTETEEPGTVDGIMKLPIWSGSSSSKTVPAVTKDGDFIVNSAGDPLEGIEMDISEPRLTLVQYYASHSTVVSMQRTYTDTVNSGTWNGGAAKTWRCLGCSFQLQSVNNALATLIFWEVTWEFAYDRTTWNLKPWDVGFAERCGEDGVASASGDKRKAILGQDKKPVKQPVALDNNGVALAVGSPPLVINNGNGEEVYEAVDFSSPFGEVYTPPAL
jgi:hypothetical protein